MTAPKILYIGGCKAVWHRLEPTIAPVRAALAPLSAAVDVTGMYHPDGGDATTGDYAALSEENLAQYDAVVLFTTGSSQGADVDAVVRYVRSGGALVAIHCAADSFKDNADYIAMIGGAFRHHPEQLDVAVEFVDTAHPITAGLEPFTVWDELYLFERYDPARVHLLAQTLSYDDDGPVPICWTRQEGEGRVFYLSIGHRPDVMENPRWQQLFLRGTEWALTGNVAAN